jgi:hypothetical protein
MIYDLIVVGGGAAGFYGAIQVAEMKSMKILLVEKTPKLLSKVKVSGGGRCNVTHYCFEPKALSKHYPRGEKVLRSIFKNHLSKQTVEWFKAKGVYLVAEEDGRMFPDTNDSQTIIDCFLREAERNSIKIETGKGVVSISKADNNFLIKLSNNSALKTAKVLIAIGGHSSPQHYDILKSLGINVVNPIPSLFTFNDSDKRFKDLMGVSVPQAEVKIAATKFLKSGPLLITHWGLSGPAVIKLSAWAAEYLHGIKYNFTCLVSWIGEAKEEETRNSLLDYKNTKGKQLVKNNALFGLPQRLWWRLCELSEIEEQKIWAELPQKNINKLLENLIRCPFKIKGKTTFKEEFVTCGGVDLNEINLETMESKTISGLYFAGEILNIDGETGGFNFQAAWSTAYVAARAIAAT